MVTKSALKVFCLLKIIEGIISIICSILNYILNSIENEPTIDKLVFNATYYGFTFLSFLGAIGTMKLNFNYLHEVAISIIGFIMFGITSIVAMIRVENDQHLISMIDIEELNHPFFKLSSILSITSLIGETFFLLHSILIIDLIYHQPRRDSSEISVASSYEPEDDEEPIKLHFLLDSLWIQIEKFVDKISNWR